MASAKILLVDDDESVRSGLQAILEAFEFEVTAASNTSEALQHIAREPFDVLLTDLHMPGPGDGLTVASAMRQSNPKAVTLLLSANPDLARAATAMVQQIDEVVLKPVKAGPIVELIHQRLAEERVAPAPVVIEDIATVVEREMPTIMEAWVAEMEKDGILSRTSLPLEERREHLPDALRDILFRLRYRQPLGSTTLFSMSALQHGARRKRQGISAVTIIEEARALQVVLFELLQGHMDRVDLGQLPAALMSIADEVNAQILQGIEAYENEQAVDAPWGGGFRD